MGDLDPLEAGSFWGRSRRRCSSTAAVRTAATTCACCPPTPPTARPSAPSAAVRNGSQITPKRSSKVEMAKVVPHERPRVFARRKSPRIASFSHERPHECSNILACALAAQNCGSWRIECRQVYQAGFCSQINVPHSGQQPLTLPVRSYPQLEHCPMRVLRDPRRKPTPAAPPSSVAGIQIGTRVYSRPQ